jgi:hypothetical protein
MRPHPWLRLVAVLQKPRNRVPDAAVTRRDEASARKPDRAMVSRAELCNNWLVSLIWGPPGLAEAVPDARLPDLMAS